MRRLGGLVAAIALTAAAGASAGVGPLSTAKLHGPQFGTSGGDEPYLVGLEPRAGGGAVAALLTRLNLTDTPPGDFILRAVGDTGAPAGPEVVFDEKSNIQSAAMALDAAGERGLAAWDAYEDGEGREAGPIFLRPFTTDTAQPTGPREKVAGATKLVALEALGDGYLLVHEPLKPTGVSGVAASHSRVTLQQLDATGAPGGQPTQANLFEPEVYGSARRDQVLLVEPFDSKLAVVGSDGFVVEPQRFPSLNKQIVTEAARTPAGEWLLFTINDRRGTRPKLRTLTDDGELSKPRNVKGLGAGSYAGEIAFAGRRGLLVFQTHRTCDGFYGLALDKRGALAAGARPARLTTAPNCARSAVSDTELAAASRRRFVLGWTHSNGDAGHYVYATGVKR